MPKITKKDRFTIIECKDFTTIIEQISENRFISKQYRGGLTEKYDDRILCKRFGEVIEPAKFLELVSQDGFKKNDKYMMIYKDMKQTKACTSLETMKYYKDWASHMVPNGFYKWNDRGNENLRHLRWMGFDFELRRSDGRHFAPAEVYQIFTNKGIEPTFVVPSKTKGNYHVYIAHSEMTGHTESIYLHQKIQKYFAELIGCDMGAIGPAHPFRMPKQAWYFGLTVLDVDVLKEAWIKHLKVQLAEEKEKRTYLSFKTEQIWHHDAIRSLMECKFNGSRNHACFTLALLFYVMNKDKSEAYAFLWEWYKSARQLGTKPFYPTEIRKAVRSAFSGKYRGPKREYIEALTGIEFPINIYGKKRKKIDDRTGEYRKTNNENIMAIINFLRDRGGAVTMFQKDIITELINKGFAERSIKRNLVKLKEEGVIDYQASQGEHAKTPTFRLLETEIEVHETTFEYDRTYRPQNRFLGVLNPSIRSKISGQN